MVLVLRQNREFRLLLTQHQRQNCCHGNSTEGDRRPTFLETSISKSDSRAREITGSFEKRAPGPIENSVVAYVRNGANFFISS